MRRLVHAVAFTSLFVIGCSSDSKSTHGAGGTGGGAQGGAGGIAVGTNECKGQETPFDATYTVNGSPTKLPAITENCALTCLTSGTGTKNVRCVNACIQGDIGGAVTTSCTQCLALSADCGKTHCSSQCLGGAMSAACTSCQCAAGCTDLFATCSGLAPDVVCP